ncbi:MAG: YggT family protein [Treponema sp.]|nr:YggT family protein [Treponema sp.]
MQNTIQIIFQLCSTAVSIYAMLCFVRIMLTWFPGLEYSQVGRFLSQMCDPYMNLFSRIPLRIGMIDFTPVLSLGLLTLLSSVLAEISLSGRIYIGGILAQIIQLLWSAATSIMGILLLVCFVRYCFAIFSKKSNNYDSPWRFIDSSISKIVFAISSPLSGGKPIDYKKALLLSCITLLFLLIIGNILIRILISAITLIPF